ncbi:MAG: hypothetical protein O7J95_10930 [Planctomycetota bacterium]|nr:hypothetical protein [Planctomycetota bacterium]
MRRKSWWATTSSILAIVLGLTTSAHGQAEGRENGGLPDFRDYVEGGDAPVASEDTDYISLDVKDKDLNDVLKTISRRVGVNIIADSNVRETVTVTFDRVEWRNALDVIAEQTHCKILEQSARLIRFTQPPSISMEFQDADIKVVLELLAKQAGANIIMSSAIQGKVSLSLRDVPWREALDTLVKTAGYVIVRTGDELSNTTEILRVVRPESLLKQLETRHFPLKYVRPREPYQAIISDLENFTTGPGANKRGEEGAAGEGEGAGEFSLEAALREIVSADGGALRYDEHTNTFIVKDIKPKLDEIERIIRLVDVAPALVYVEVKFIRTTNADILERGIKFDLPNTPERDGFTVIARSANPGEVVQLTSNLANDPLAIFGGTFPFNIGALDKPPFGLSDFQALGILDFTQTRMLLRLVKDDERSRIVQEPSLTMLDNKAAVIFVGDEIPFAVQKVQQDQNGNIIVTIEENDRSPINVGFTLYLRPNVIPGTDLINLTVIPRVSTLSGTTSSIEGFERFEFQQEGGQTQASIDLPRLSSQTVVTHLRVEDRHTAVIGGLQTERRIEIESRIPLLSSIPLLGNLFTWKRKQNNVESLLILITPHILKGEVKDHITQRAIKKHQKTDFFFNTYEKDQEEEDPAEESGWE